MNSDKLIHMANHIAAFFASYPETQAQQGIRDHLQRFWEPRMREQLRSELEQGTQGLSPLVRAALRDAD